MWHATHVVRPIRWGAFGTTLRKRIFREIVWWSPRFTADSGRPSLITSANSRNPRAYSRRAVPSSIPGTRANARTDRSSDSSRSPPSRRPHASHTAILPGNIFPHVGQIARSRRRIVAHRGQIGASVGSPHTGHRPAIPRTIPTVRT